jgi:hypothetical protein
VLNLSFGFFFKACNIAISTCEGIFGLYRLWGSEVFRFELKSQAEGVKKKLGEEFPQNYATVKVLGGEDDGHIFQLGKDQVRIGRIDLEHQDNYDPLNDVVLSDSYGVVTRASKPHAMLLHENGQWLVEQCEGVNGIYLWEKMLIKKGRNR